MPESVRTVTLDEMVARVARGFAQPLYGPYPTSDGWMPAALLYGLYDRLAQMEALAQAQAARAVGIGFGGEGAAAAYTQLREEALPDDGW